ncbi:MAG: F0F1 ATP synthase subunit delta [bacterium]
MKYKARDYAEALVQIISEKGDNLNEKKTIQGFLKLLERQSDLKKAKEILGLAKILLVKKSGNKTVALHTARKLSASQKNLLSKFIKKGDLIEEKITPELIAGIKIVIDNEEQLDETLLRKINNLINKNI